jgi:two-component system LytT family sensor kinase
MGIKLNSNKMKLAINIQRFRFYLWVGAGYLLIWLFNSVINYPDTFAARALNETWRAVYITIVNFVFFEFVMRFILKKRRFFIYNIVLFVFAFWLMLMVCSFGLYVWRGIGIGLHIYTALTTFKSLAEALTVQASFGIMSILFFGIIKHIYDYRKLIESTQKLRIEKQEAELSYLKSQTNPHFLFNTLNNIYSLARDKSDLAPESILRLSGILRFMLYETGGEYIPIEQELKIIDDYIALEKLRYDDTLRINFKYEIDDMKRPFPPLLLIPLVENAFKHGVSETRDHPFIEISLMSDKKQLEFIVKNSAEGYSGESNVKENIGLSNIRRQLELLYKIYELSFSHNEGVFTATLKINLASHV